MAAQLNAAAGETTNIVAEEAKEDESEPVEVEVEEVTRTTETRTS